MAYDWTVKWNSDCGIRNVDYGKIVAGIIGVVAASLGWHDLMVLCALAAIVAGTTRRLLAVSTVLLFTISFPPYSWPTWWFCLAPMAWMWRDRVLKMSMFRVVVESVAVGFAMGWISTGFVRAGLPAWQESIHAVGCIIFSLQVVAVAVAIRLTRNKPVLLSAPICALAAVAGELFEAWCGVSWSVTNLALTVGATPVAQWARWITPFGVSGLLYLVNFTLVRENAPTFRRRWMGPALGMGIGVLAWCGGSLITNAVSVEPLPFRALLVQPHLIVSDEKPWRPWLDLDRLTRAALSQDDSVDLIVWPESCLSAGPSDAMPSDVSHIATRLTVQDFVHRLTPVYKTNCLVGVVIIETGMTQRYGLEVAEVRRYNCGCMVSESGAIARHEKMELVPCKETLPRLLDNRWIRHRLLPALQLNQQLTPGREFKPLSFRDQQGNKRSIAVSICYESFFPWLPQYHNNSNVDAIVHLVYDGNTAAYPAMIERHILACQYRAIESRRWNLVCSTWTGSTIIDPSGRIVSQLSATAGTLRSDVTDGKEN